MTDYEEYCVHCGAEFDARERGQRLYYDAWACSPKCAAEFEAGEPAGVAVVEDGRPLVVAIATAGCVAFVILVVVVLVATCLP